MGIKELSCTGFLQWALPQLRLRWRGYRKVKRQVCKRISDRMKELEMEKLEDYKNLLQQDLEEWKVLDGMMHISISRFFRDTHSWQILEDDILPGLAARAQKEERDLRCWSAGCASGEEPYSMAILWMEKINDKFENTGIEIIATDANTHMIKRAKEASYGAGSLKHVPLAWLHNAFEENEAKYYLKNEYRLKVSVQQQDVRETMPGGPFDIIFCKNLVSMYFEPSLAVDIFRNICERLRPGGVLLLGNHEEFPLHEIPQIENYNAGTHIYIHKPNK